VLGYLSPDYFLGGEMRLDRTRVDNAIEEHVARPLGMSVAQAAVGIHEVVNENMAAATRMHAAEKGQDPRRFTLIAFGGAGPVHAYGLARLLKIRRVICPFGAGVTSALGMLVAAPSTDLVRSYVSRLDHIDWDHLNGLYAEMETEARALLVESGADPAEITLRRAADMRYVGQEHPVTVDLPIKVFARQDRAAIEDLHRPRALQRQLEVHVLEGLQLGLAHIPDQQVGGIMAGAEGLRMRAAVGAAAEDHARMGHEARALLRVRGRDLARLELHRQS